MGDDEDGGRHSKAATVELIADPTERAAAEARNALEQFDIVQRLIDETINQAERPFKLRPSTIQTLHRAALQGLSPFAGNWRPGDVEIGQSEHKPPKAHLVAFLIEEMCDYVNDHKQDKSAIHLSSYVMWRLNWIHPFDDGNGRTSRAVSYLVLSALIGMRLPGRHTIPEQIAENKTPYYRALETADIAAKEERIDVSALENLMSDYLAKQLLRVHEAANNSDMAADKESHPKLH